MGLSVRRSVLNGKLFAVSHRHILSTEEAKSQSRSYTDGKRSGNPEALPRGGSVNNVRDDRAELQDFYLSILSATASRRDARSYLKRFTLPPVTRLPYAGLAPRTPEKPALSPKAFNKPDETHVNGPAYNAVALKPSSSPGLGNPRLFAPKITDEELHIALVKVRDIDSIADDTLQGVGRTLESLKRLGLTAVVVLDEPDNGSGWRAETDARADRIVSAIEKSRGRARRIDDALTISAESLSVSLPQLILAPLSRGVIPILSPRAFDPVSHRHVAVDANDIISTLTNLFSYRPPSSSESPMAQPISLDRLIFLDPLGGIPAPDRPAGAHVFVNMQQEYPEIAANLEADGHLHHLKSLQTLRSALAVLPPTTSAVITTPAAAAAAGAKLPEPNSPRIKNPLIHNLLTDKPIFSSSLPTATSPSTQTTLLKHGTPLQVFPSGTKLTSPDVDLRKLVALIEDSFGKTLDVAHYLARVNSHIAGLIIAGDYEGAAIVTWETPPGKPHARVCYLDKFAVAKRSQGVGGVADVVFKAMAAGVRPGGLFEGVEGIVWRSRRTNVVNKWYFERAKGTWKFPGAGDAWTMFWTTEDVKVGMQRFADYADVCASIQPSLRDRGGKGGEGGEGGR
ncbi:hypothetical protein BZA05DRAFT_375628 [Tricharina praecox]|uniref:uncharacterized protein n=1 Tax=Tricharina praecox TaxID=43433 RepID=UPI002220ED50|nr:uncharacterized protein BZA05DRAFT_375628 [Tricharina praecox]KAI5848845.1 hypothetical protein BZA05DRAFT_375628 [Tricharina praecox]